MFCVLGDESPRERTPVNPEASVFHEAPVIDKRTMVSAVTGCVSPFLAGPGLLHGLRHRGEREGALGHLPEIPEMNRCLFVTNGDPNEGRLGQPGRE